MESIPIPTSTVLNPMVERWGPTVEPQALVKGQRSVLYLHKKKRMPLHIISHFKLLHLTSLLLDELLHHKTTDGIACIALLRVRLDNNASIDHGSVILFMFRRIVRVDCMPHVTGNQE